MAKDCLWLLCDPVSAYKEWLRLLSPGGSILVIDGNHHLHQFNQEYKRRKEYLNLRNGKDNNLHAKTNINKVDLTRIDVLADDLPLSRQVRPAWDVEQLMSLGAQDINVKLLDSSPYRMVNENGSVILPFSFAVIARKSLFSEIRTISKDEITAEEMINISNSVKRDREVFDEVSRLLSDPNKLAILYVLNRGTMNVSTIAEMTEMSISAVSHSLDTMKRLGVVVSTKKSRNIYYRIDGHNRLGKLIKVIFETVQYDMDLENGM